MTAPAILEIRNLTARYRDKTVLDRVSLDIRRGEHLVLIGPNGAGKTTLLKCLMRIHEHLTGEIRVEGRPLSRYSQKRLARLMSYVPQANGQAPEFSAREFVTMGRYPRLGPFSRLGDSDRRAVRGALTMTGVASLAERPLRSLSGGEKQRVLIAAGLAQGAKILLLDEPTAFLDPRQQAKVQTVLSTLHQSLGLTICSVTHDINSAALWADRVVGLKAGRVIFDGTGEELMDNRVLGALYDRRFAFADHPSAGKRIVVPDGRAP